MLFLRIVAHSKSMLQTLLMPMGFKKKINSILTNKGSVCILSKMKALDYLGSSKRVEPNLGHYCELICSCT